MKAFRHKEMKIEEYYVGHMPKMAAKPIYGTTLQKASPPELVDRYPRNFVYGIGVSSQ